MCAQGDIHTEGYIRTHTQCTHLDRGLHTQRDLKTERGTHIESRDGHSERHQDPGRGDMQRLIPDAHTPSGSQRETRRCTEGTHRNRRAADSDLTAGFTGARRALTLRATS